MRLIRCDDCCNVLDGVDDGDVYECDADVYKKTSFEHLCIDCIENYDGLYLYSKDGYFNLVKFKSKDKK